MLKYFQHPLFTVKLFVLFVLIGGGRPLCGLGVRDAKGHVQKRVHRRDGAHNLLAIGQAPDSGQGKVQRAQRRK